MTRASAFIQLSQEEVVTDEWEILSDDGSVEFTDVVLVVLGLIACIVPGVVAIFLLALRPRRKGYLCLTNWRCLYYERGEGLFRNFHRFIAMDLADIIAVHSTYEENFLGTKSLLLSVSTKHDDRMAIQIGDRGQWLSWIPVIGTLFRNNTLGCDATEVPPRLFALIEDRRAHTTESQVAY